MSHINYGLLAWGHVQERIFKLQKKSVRIITCSKYNAHSMPIFKKLKMLKLEDIYYLQLLKFYHKYVHNKLPHYFSMTPFYQSNTVHGHNTRRSEHIHILRPNHEFAKKSVRHKIPIIINGLEKKFKDKLFTHSLKGFSNYVKNNVIDSYTMICNVHNCYICNRT